MASAVLFRPQPAVRRIGRAEFVWMAFVVMQVLDGTLSYIGVSTYGTWMEGNPLVAWYVHMLGPAAAFGAAKLFALTCGAVLYATARHAWLTVLALAHFLFAVAPWVYLLTLT